MRPTVRDIARRANVSPATVSRVLNNHPYVGDSTRLAVQRVIREMDYSISHLRRASKAPDVLTALILTREDFTQTAGKHPSDLNALISAGAAKQFAAAGITAQTLPLSHDLVQRQRLLDSYHHNGLILVGGVHEQPFVSKLITDGIPFVVAGAHLRPLQVNCVMADYVNGILEAVNHLVARGRRRIALINGPATTRSSEEKYRGFRLGLALHDLPFDPAHMIYSVEDFTPRRGHAATVDLLTRYPTLDAIIYAFDYTAIGGLTAIKETGRRVPDDVAVIGCHDFEMARYTDPPLTSIAFDMPRMGALAAQRLIHLFRNPGESAPTTTIVPTELHVRISA